MHPATALETETKNDVYWNVVADILSQAINGEIVGM